MRTGLAAPLVLVLGLAACGRHFEPPRARAPRLDDDSLRCREAARNASPIVTEWSAAEKASLQARMRAGALAVEFTGCTMRPIPGCVLRGSYRWQRTTLASDTIDVRSADELYAKLPLGAASLSGELAKSGRLAVQTTVGGQFVLEGSRAADVPDYGECAGATHLLTGLSSGAFKLRSGGSLRGGAGLGVGELAAGASSESSEQVLRESGNPESCKASTDEAPELDCSAPIQAFLEPLPRFAAERGQGTSRATFSAADASRPWELRTQQEFVCKLPCTRWIKPGDAFQVRAEGGTLPETIEVEDLHRHAGAAELDVRAYPRDGGMLTSGIVTTALGGVGVFFGGFFALFGAMAERDGLVVAGGVTSAVGAVAVVPGIWMIVESGARTEITPVGFAPPSRLVEPPRFGFAASF